MGPRSVTQATQDEGTYVNFGVVDLERVYIIIILLDFVYAEKNGVSMWSNTRLFAVPT